MKRIRTKLWLGMMILVGIIIILLWLFQIVFLEQFYSNLELKGVSKHANQIVTEIEKLEDVNKINQTAEITDSIEKFVYEKKLSIQIIDKSYQTIYQIYSENHANLPKRMNEVTSEVIEKALLGTEGKVQVTHPKFLYQFVVMAIPIHQGDSVLGAMIVTLPMASIDDTADILKKQLILITAILFLVSVILALQLSKRFSKPILAISKVAESYALGEYQARVNIAEKDEIGQLAVRMNDMGKALARNEVLKRELIANVSHELRTPLALIRGYAETLRDVTGDNPQKREKQLGVIIAETERLGSIVEDILNLSQLQAESIRLEQESFSLDDMIQSIKNRYELQEDKKILKVSGVNDLKENLYGDKKRIEQVFYNLINNALHHTAIDGIVEIIAIEAKDRVRIQVKDNGEGIAKEDLEHVFERYYKGKRVGEKKENGIGLGLSIVKNILELHKVPYGVESELGKGTTFWFDLYKESYHTSF